MVLIKINVQIDEYLKDISSNQVICVLKINKNFLLFEIPLVVIITDSSKNVFEEIGRIIPYKTCFEIWN